MAAVLDERRQPPPSHAFAQQLTELTWMWTTTALAPDLERFAQHAKRSRVAPEDVVLASRKNEVTHALINGASQRLKGTNKRKEREPR